MKNENPTPAQESVKPPAQNDDTASAPKAIRYRIVQKDAEDFALFNFITGKLNPADFPRDPLCWLPENQKMAAFVYSAVLSFSEGALLSEDWFLASADEPLAKQWEQLSASPIFPDLDAEQLRRCFQRYDANNAARDLAGKLWKWRKGEGITDICAGFNEWMAQAANDATIATASEGDGSFSKLLAGLAETGILHEPDTLDIPILTEKAGIRIRLGELSLLTARTSIGKSIYARQVALAVSDHTPVLYHSLENHPTELLRNFARAIEPRVAKEEFLGSRIEKAKRIAQLIKLKKLHVYHAEHTLQNMLATATMHARRDAVKLWVIDWLGFLKVATAATKVVPEQVTIGIICKALKNWAVKHNAAVLLVAQLNRIAEGARPQLHHLKESGSLEECSQMVIYLHGDRLQTRRELGVLKNSCGQLATVNCDIDIKTLTLV